MRDFGVGAVLGLFVGLLIGLSASEVVAGVLTALVALLGGLFGLRSETAPGPVPGGNAGRIAGFALAGIVALLLGLTARTHAWLEPSPAHTRDQWLAAGFADEEARALTAFQRLGLLPQGREAGEAKSSNARTGALFSDPANNDACDALLARQYGSADALASAMRAEGSVWARLAGTVAAGQEDAARLSALRSATAALCERP